MSFAPSLIHIKIHDKYLAIICIQQSAQSVIAEIGHYLNVKSNFFRVKPHIIKQIQQNIKQIQSKYSKIQSKYKRKSLLILNQSLMQGSQQTKNTKLEEANSQHARQQSQTNQNLTEQQNKEQNITITKKKSDITLKDAEEFVKNIQTEIRPQAWIRNNYYQKLGIDIFDKQRQQNLQKQESYQNDNYNIVIFSPRTSDQIRNRYLSKLNIYGRENQESGNLRKRHQHFFIFDWDDTILCTSYLSSMQFLQINNDAKNLLKKLDETSSTLLSKVIQKGQIYIITNAAKGWVEYSSKLYLPKTHQIVQNSHIKICSARSMFGQEYPGDFGRWKMEAFKNILSNVDKYVLNISLNQLVTNLICIGDSNIQMEAAHCVGKQFYHGLIKTIKFRENPKPDQLIKQQELVNSKLSQIFESTKNLTIRLERKGNK